MHGLKFELSFGLLYVFHLDEKLYVIYVIEFIITTEVQLQFSINIS